MEEETYNRLFILGGKGCQEDEWRTIFGEFGSITNVQIVVDRKTSEQKGVVYITFDKISEAAKAMEEMCGKFIPNFPKPLKVMIASTKREGNVKDPKEDEKILRLFIVCDKSSSENDLRDHFEQYGDIEYVRILRDRSSQESKGLAYVKYFRAYHAALAFENCDRKHKPRFAELKMSRESQRGSSQSSSLHGNYSYDGYGAPPPPPRRSNTMYDSRPSLLGDATQQSHHSSTDALSLIEQYPSTGETRLEAMVAGCNAEQVYRLFDLIPGLDYCNYDPHTGMACVRYTQAGSTAYAKDKLQNFEYPLGNHIVVRYPVEYNSGQCGDGDGINSSLADLSRELSSESNVSTLVKSIQKATEVLQKAGLGHALGGGSPASGNGALMGSPPSLSSGNERVRWCNVPLPLRQPLEPRDASCEERLFVVCQPDAIPDQMLVDVFCRFGALIDAYFMPGKNYGYAKFSKLERAKVAQDTLHGQTVCNMRLKVIHADPPKFDDDEKSKKRPRT